MINSLNLHELQAAILTIRAKRTFIVAGRNWGKSALFGSFQQLVAKSMPGSTSIIAAKTYGHLLTSVLPSAMAMLERLGYYKDIHYWVGRPFPTNWKPPFHPPVKRFENYISFFNSADQRCSGFDLRSLDKTSSRGPNRDFLMTDETLLINKDKLNSELRPTIRANKSEFKHINFHLGEFHSTSMPITQEGKWILDEAGYYLNDFGIDIISIWKQVVNLQISLLDAEDKKDFQLIWNEIQRLRRLIAPRLSKDGTTLFVFGNALDNWRNDGGLKYLKEQRKSLPLLIFLIEIMNMVVELTENNFYSISRDKHIYYNSYNNDFLEDLAISSNFSSKLLSDKNSSFLSLEHYDPNEPIIVGFDWGGTISFMLSCQKFKGAFTTLNFQKEFFVKPEVGEMTEPLIKQFCEYYRFHTKKRITFVRDTYGDDKSNSINNSQTINEQAMGYLRKNGWEVSSVKHPGKEPPYFEKWQLINNCLKESDKKFYAIRINGNECKNLTLSLHDTKTTQVDGTFKKDKKAERKDNVDQAKTTHSTDAFDKIIYTVFKLETGHSFIPTKLA